MRQRTVLIVVFLVALAWVLLLAGMEIFGDSVAETVLQSAGSDSSMWMHDFAGHTCPSESKVSVRNAHTGVSFVSPVVPFASPVSPDGNGNLAGGVGPLGSDSTLRTTPGGAATLGWHQEAHDAQHTGYSPEDVPLPWTFQWQWNGSCVDPIGSDCRPGDPELGWMFLIPPKSHLVAGDSRLYLPVGEHGVWALGQSDGKTIWHNGAIESFCTAAFDPETNALFVAASDGRLYKLNPSNGTILDSFLADSGLNLSPTIATGRVYVVSDSGILYAVDKNAMNLVWSYPAGSPGQTPAGYSERYDVLVFGTEDLYVHCVNNSDGLGRWRVKPAVNENDGSTYDGGDRRYPTYNYEHGWPVIAEEHGIVFLRLHLPKSALWQVPGPDNWFPSSNEAIRSFLIDRPDLQTLFALNLNDGSSAFIPAVGTGGGETPDKDNTLGPLPVVRRLANGDEVAYTIWRNGQKCEAGDCSDPRWDAVMGEMVLDSTTVPGYQAGDLRFVTFREGSEGVVTDELWHVSMAGDTLFHSHHLALRAYRITDRSNSIGDTYSNPIQTERQGFVLPRASNREAWVTYQPESSHFCDGWLAHYTTSGGARVFYRPFWVFFNYPNPPCQDLGIPCSLGYTPSYVVVHNGVVYFELEGGTIFAVKSVREPWAEVDKQVRPVAPSAGDTITYTLNILGNGYLLTLTDPLPEGLGIPGPVISTLGEATYDSHRRLVIWNGAPDARQLVTITFPVTVQVDGPLALVNTAVLTDTDGRVSTDTAVLIVDAYQCYLPLTLRSY